MPRQITHISVKSAGQTLGIAYESLLSVASQVGVVLADPATRLPILPLSFLRGLSQYRRCAPGFLSPRGPNFDIPRIDPLTSGARLLGIRELKRRLPYRFLLKPGVEIPHEKMLKDRGENWVLMQLRAKYISPMGSFMGGFLEDRLLTCIRKGNYRMMVRGPMTLYDPQDFEDGFSWASPAERSFRKGADLLEALLGLWRKKGEVPGLNKKGAGLLAARELARKGREQLEGAMRPDAREKTKWPVAPEAVVRYADGEVAIQKEMDFTWQGKNYPLGRASVAALVEVTRDMCQAWADLLLEERTAYRRGVYGTPHPQVPGTDCLERHFEEHWATQALSQEQFERDYTRVEKEVYQNRLAFEAGILTPLLPEGFRFLF